MSIHDQVDAAVKAMIITAAPGAEVVGLDGEEASPARAPVGGRVVVEDGDPGEPEVTLSPLAYSYDRAIGFTVTAPDDATAGEILDAIAAAIAADRFLGGLVEFLTASAPLRETEYVDGAPVLATAAATIVASYSTTRPL